ncbi:DUF3187 family protein [Photobacterium sp. SDRW27]|uniref:DUF3187 family protein n=1 Tax=Photobacterium obscurum TaxID=2829490 RepID=UPI002242D760|nr:DUF3187 family protein [Photobacterium obscurum]MCW8328811.1 DUF3187 family protein [Photobacterium obscurum]
MNTRSITVYLLSGGAAFCTSGYALADSVTRFDDYGPLKTYAQSPIQSNSLTPLMRNGFSYQPGTVELYTTGTIASVWAKTDEYSADYYQNALSIGGLWQINNKWVVELDYTWRFAANNHLDNLTNSFHDLFGIGANGRDEVDDHSFDISVPQYGVEIHDFSGETLSSAVTFYTSYQLFENAHHGLSLGGSLYYNYVPSGPFKTNNFEQSIQLNYSYRNKKNTFYSLFGLSYRHNDEVLGNVPYNTVAFAAGAGYQYQLREKHRLLAEYHIYEGATDAASDLSEPSHEILLGYRYHMKHSAIEVSMIENVFNMDNSTDIAFTLGYRHRF